jgi:DNA-binding CsgD family transcriptional regulator
VATAQPAVSLASRTKTAARDDNTVLVEREGELAVITRAISDALGGDGGVVLIEGPAGIGKTQLLREIRSRAAGRVETATVLNARGSQLEREYGFGVVRQLFEPFVAGADHQAIFAGAAGPARGVFTAQQDSGSQSGDSAFGVLHGLYWLAANLAATDPLIITVDDVQWCDVGSLRFLGFLAHRLEELPISLVLTLRTGEHHDNDDLLAEIVSEASVLVVAPKPLSATGVTELVRKRLGESPEEAFVAACRRTTGGNPLLLRQLLRALESDGIKPTSSNADTVRAIGSRAVSSLVLRRFARMPPENRSVAGAVAVLGDNATLPLVAKLTALPEEAVGSAIGALARAELLRDEYPLDFVHPLVRDAVYSDVPLGQRELQHAQAARLLAYAGAAAEQVVAHLLKIPPRGETGNVDVLLAAAARSVARGAPDGAVTYLQRALAEPAGPDREGNIYLELGRVVTMTDIPAALIHLSAARDRLRDIRERAHAAVLLGRVEVFGGARGSSRRTAESMLHQLPAELGDERQWLQAISRVSTQMHLLDPVTGPLPEVVGNGPGAVSLASALSWDITRAGTDRDRAVELARFALTGDVLDDVDQGFLGVVARIVLEIAEAAPTQQWDDALASAYRKGSLFAVLGAQLWGGYTHWLRGDLDEALQWLRNSTEQIGRWGAPQIGQTYTDAFTVQVLVDRGDLAGAEALLAAEKPFWDSVSESHMFLLAGRAKVLFHRGLVEPALKIHDRIAELTVGIDNPAWRSWQENRAEVLIAVGRRAEAVEIVEADIGFAQRWGTSLGLGRTLRVLGTIREDGIGELREAVAVLQPSDAKLELAKARATLGEKLVRDQKPPPAEAVQELQAAYLLAAECSALGLQSRIGELLSRTDLAIPDPPRRLKLTSTEQRIVEMSLNGAFDQDIAQALYITTPTVRQTLESVRRRIGKNDVDQVGVAAGR